MRVELPDGRIAEFPDDMSREDISAVLRKQFGEPEQVAEKAGSAVVGGMRQIPRQIGLTARAGLTGVGDTLGILSNPIASTINLGSQALGSDFRIPFAGQAMEGLANTLGLPQPETPNERVAQGTARIMAGVGGAGGVANLAATKGGGMASEVGKFLGQRLGEQVGSAAGGGGFSELVREGGGTPLEQGAAGLLGSVLGGVAANRLSRGASMISRPPVDMDARIERMLNDQGVRWADVPAGAKDALRREMAEAMSSGKDIDPAAMRRLLDFKVVGATPTRGTITLDPAQITREKNLAKIGANSASPELHTLARIEHGNNRALVDAANKVRGEAVDPMRAGQDIVGAVTARDARFKGIENRLYDRARSAAGRPIPLDGDAFVRQAYEKLAQENKGAFLPENIGKLLQDIRAGKMTQGGQEFDVPFNVDVIDNLKTTLAAASRGSADGNVRSAIKQVRDALESVPVAPVKREFGGGQVVTAAQAKALQDADALPGKALRAFNRARKVAASRRNWQESAKGIEAALDGAAPDNFVQKFIVGDGASFSDVAKITREINRNPQARESTRSAIVQFLKDKAMGGASDEVGNFSQSGYNRAFKQVQRKLGLFFSPEEVTELEAIGRVASYTQVQPRGSAVNNSNTAALAGGRLIDMLGSTKFLPFGRQLVADPLESIRLQMSNRQALNATGGLLMPAPGQSMAQPLLLPGALSTGLLTAE